MSIAISHPDILQAYQGITSAAHDTPSTSQLDLVVLEYDDSAQQQQQQQQRDSTISNRTSIPSKALRLAFTSSPTPAQPNAAARLAPLLNPGEVLFALLRVEAKLLIVQYLAADISGVRRARALVHGRAVCSHFSTADANVVITKREELTDSIIRTHLKLGPAAAAEAAPGIRSPLAQAAQPTTTASLLGIDPSPRSNDDGRRNSSRSVADEEWRSLRSRTPIGNEQTAAQAAFAAHQQQQRLSMAASVLTMPEEDEETRLQREKEEFLAFQREEALRSEAIDRERQRRREKELIRRDEAKREEVMRRLRLEQEKDVTTVGIRGSSPNSMGNGTNSPAPGGVYRSGTPSKAPSSHIGNGRRSSSTGLITPPLSISHDGHGGPRSPSRGPPMGPPPSVPPPQLRETDLQPVLLSRPAQASPVPAMTPDLTPLATNFPRDSVQSINSSVLAQSFGSARPSTGMSRAIDGVDAKLEEDDEGAPTVVPNGLVVATSSPRPSDESVSPPSPANASAMPSSSRREASSSTALSADDRRAQPRSRSRSGDSVEHAPRAPSNVQVSHDRIGSSSSATDRIVSSRAQKRLLEQAGHGGEHWISRHGRRKSEDRDVGDQHGYSDASFYAHQRIRAESSSAGDGIAAPAQANGVAGAWNGRTDKELPAVPAGETVDDGTAAAMARRAKDARKRALAAEAAALAQIERARAEQRRLALQVSEAERRDRERSEAEAAARAKWAREQAERDRLDAFERSKLEAEERRRRSAVESLRKEEGRRAAEARRERIEREREEREAIEMGERRRKDAEEREKRLQEEAERRRKIEEESRGKEQSERVKKQRRREEVNERVQAGEDVGTGWVSVQMGDAVVWRRRYLHFAKLADGTAQLLLSKTEEARDLAAPLDRLDLGHDSVRSLSDAYEETMMLHSFKLVLRRGGGAEDYTVLHLATDSLDDKETLVCVIELLGGRLGDVGRVASSREGSVGSSTSAATAKLPKGSAEAVAVK